MTSELTLSEKHKIFESAFNEKISSPYFLVRLDGKNFSKRVKKWEMNGPFDERFHIAMTDACKALMKDISDIKMIWTGSDEATLVFKKYEEEDAGWYNKRLNKILSLTSSMMTAYFNMSMNKMKIDVSSFPAFFDCRRVEYVRLEDLLSNLIYRQNDCIRNSISMYADVYFKEKELTHKNGQDKIEMIRSVGHDWEADVPEWAKYGTLLYKFKKLFKKNNDENVYYRTKFKEEMFKLNIEDLMEIYENDKKTFRDI